MSVTLSVITGGLYTIISESKFTQPVGLANIAFGLSLLYNITVNEAAGSCQRGRRSVLYFKAKLYNKHFNNADKLFFI